MGELILGTECGGSDFTSGLASNPAVGVASDMLVGEGGTVILSETPELIGAEHLLARRARTPEIARKVLDAVAWWEAKAIEGGQNIREVNPSPGNKEGGITTLEEKSLGCIHKAGTTALEEFVTAASHPTRKGLVYMDTPAHDIEQLTCMVAGGSQIVVFTTGRGTPCGSPIGAGHQDHGKPRLLSLHEGLPRHGRKQDRPGQRDGAGRRKACLRRDRCRCLGQDHQGRKARPAGLLHIQSQHEHLRKGESRYTILRPVILIRLPRDLLPIRPDFD